MARRAGGAARSIRDLLPIGAIVGVTALGITALVGPVTSDIRAGLAPAKPATSSAAPAATDPDAPVAIEIRDALRSRSLPSVTRLPVLGDSRDLLTSAGSTAATVRQLGPIPRPLQGGPVSELVLPPAIADVASPPAAVVSAPVSVVEPVEVVLSAQGARSTVATEAPTPPPAKKKKVAASFAARFDKAATKEAKADAHAEHKADHKAAHTDNRAVIATSEPPRGKALGHQR